MDPALRALLLGGHVVSSNLSSDNDEAVAEAVAADVPEQERMVAFAGPTLELHHAPNTVIRGDWTDQLDLRFQTLWRPEHEAKAAAMFGAASLKDLLAQCRCEHLSPALLAGGDVMRRVKLTAPSRQMAKMLASCLVQIRVMAADASFHSGRTIVQAVRLGKDTDLFRKTCNLTDPAECYVLPENLIELPDTTCQQVLTLSFLPDRFYLAVEHVGYPSLHVPEPHS